MGRGTLHKLQYPNILNIIVQSEGLHNLRRYEKRIFHSFTWTLRLASQLCESHLSSVRNISLSNHSRKLKEATSDNFTKKIFDANLVKGHVWRNNVRIHWYPSRIFFPWMPEGINVPNLGYQREFMFSTSGARGI